MINVLPDAHTAPATRNVDQTVSTTQRERHHVPKTGQVRYIRFRCRPLEILLLSRRESFYLDGMLPAPDVLL